MAADELPEVVPAPTEEETVAVGVSAMGAQEEVPPPSEEEPPGRVGQSAFPNRILPPLESDEDTQVQVGRRSES